MKEIRINHLDIIVPCFNENKCVELFYTKIKMLMEKQSKYTFSIIFVDDGSTDETLHLIKKLVVKDGEHIEYISFARNFGKEAAIYAGLEKSSGEMVVLMDVDLQDPPDLITQMLSAIEEGYDCCVARRKSRDGEPIIRSLFSNLFYVIMNKISLVELEPGARDFRLMTRKVVDAILSINERERFSKGLMSWVGFNIKWVEYDNIERVAGKTKWSFFKLFKYAISGIVAFSTAPLRLALVIGIVVVFGSFAYAVYMALQAIHYGRDVPGYASLLTIMIFLSGIIILLLGIIGEYLARVYVEVKGRPIYILKETSEEKRQNEEQCRESFDAWGQPAINK